MMGKMNWCFSFTDRQITILLFFNSSPELTCLILYIENLAVKDAIAGCFLQATASFDIGRTRLPIEP